MTKYEKEAERLACSITNTHAVATYDDEGKRSAVRLEAKSDIFLA